EAHDLDATWIGTWEEALGEARTIAIDSEAAVERATIFLAGLDTREQLEAIAAAAHQFLGDESCTRVGIVFPTASALPRLVASALTRRGLAHYDAMGQMAPGLFEIPDFWSWMELQRTPRLNVLLRFLTALPNDQSFLEDPSRDKIGRALQRALADIAIDDLTLLVAAARERDGDGERIAVALANIVFLPDKGTFTEFLEICANAFALLGWNERWREIAQRTTWTTKRGSQGEGHSVVGDGATLFLGADQQRQLARAQFDGLIESTTHGVALTASLVQEAAPERLSNPAEFFGRVYHEVHGQPVSQANMRTLREETRRWLEAANFVSPNEQSETPGILQTRAAYLARRASQPANEYDIALRAAPDEIEPLSVSDTEALLKSPALIWMERFLGVEGAEDPTYVWNATIGKWTHDWLAAVFGSAGTFVAFPGEDEFAAHILAAAERKRAEVRELCRLARRTIPDWWDSGWEN